MHLELPNVRLQSLKDFAKHYLMIVLSILTALGLEAWIEHRHHAEAAAATVSRMDSELRTNLDGIGKAIARNDRSMQSLIKLGHLIERDLKAGASVDALNADIRLHRSWFALNLNFPSLSNDAWDVAVADQSAGWIAPEALQRYSSAYSAQRELVAWMDHDAALLFNGPKMVDDLTDLELGNQLVPRDFLYEVRQMETTLGSAQVELHAIQDELRKDLRLPAVTSPLSASSAGKGP